MSTSNTQHIRQTIKLLFILLVQSLERSTSLITSLIMAIFCLSTTYIYTFKTLCKQLKWIYVRVLVFLSLVLYSTVVIFFRPHQLVKWNEWQTGWKIGVHISILYQLLATQNYFFINKKYIVLAFKLIFKLYTHWFKIQATYLKQVASRDRATPKLKLNSLIGLSH